jgi:hypothetical protein
MLVWYFDKKDYTCINSILTVRKKPLIMLIKLDARMRSAEGAGYVAWIDNAKKFKMVVQADTPEQAAKELIISLKVTISHLFGVDINSIEHKKLSSEAELQEELSKALKESGKKDLEFALV